MRPAVLFLIMILSGLLVAQDGQRSPKIRSIRVEAISTSPEGLPSVEFETINAAWIRSQINLAVENRLDVGSLDKAKEVISEVYGGEGHAVRVEHNVNSIPPRGVEVAFQVIELCQCN